MLDQVDVGERSLSAYLGVAPDRLLDELVRAASPLAGARVLHLNATPYGGGVSELLRSVVPLLNDLGLVADWRIVNGTARFFEITKKIHNALQGAPDPLSDEEWQAYLDNARANAAQFEEQYDFIVVHDPQPAALLRFRGPGKARWIWRCHIDTSSPEPETWARLSRLLEDYDAAVFTSPEFVPEGLPVARVEIVPPAIDPLSPKNAPIPRDLAESILSWIGIDPLRPLVTQVSRFDPWKDPLGVVEVFRRVRRGVPALQLALIGSLALDDPEGWDIYREARAATRGDLDIHVFTNLVGVGNIEVNACQRLSRVTIQKSIREGFGLVVSESLWKGTPVVAQRTGGIPLQMADGSGGILVEGIEACAEAVSELLRDPHRARALGLSGRERVREHFLTPRLLLDELCLLSALRGERQPERPRDPVCGMTILDATAPAQALEGTVYRFCSEYCRTRFAREPAHYARRLRRPASGGPVR
jgi:trehalose synthase